MGASPPLPECKRNVMYSVPTLSKKENLMPSQWLTSLRSTQLSQMNSRWPTRQRLWRIWTTSTNSVISSPTSVPPALTESSSPLPPTFKLSHLVQTEFHFFVESMLQDSVGCRKEFFLSSSNRFHHGIW